MASIRRRRRARADVWLVDYRDAAGVRERLTARTKEVIRRHLNGTHAVWWGTRCMGLFSPTGQPITTAAA
jgi:hypothetical protein